MLSMTSPKDGRTLRTVQMRETDFGRKGPTPSTANSFTTMVTLSEAARWVSIEAAQIQG